LLPTALSFRYVLALFKKISEGGEFAGGKLLCFRFELVLILHKELFGSQLFLCVHMNVHMRRNSEIELFCFVFCIVIMSSGSMAMCGVFVIASSVVVVDPWRCLSFVAIQKALCCCTWSSSKDILFVGIIL
jgi:hypothetical protein